MCHAATRRGVEQEVCEIVGSPQHICSSDQQLKIAILERFTDAPERRWALRKLQRILTYSPFSPPG
jgi:hypothetical protein